MIWHFLPCSVLQGYALDDRRLYLDLAQMYSEEVWNKRESEYTWFVENQADAIKSSVFLSVCRLLV